MYESWKPDFPNWKDRFPDLVWWLDYNTNKLPRGTTKFDTVPVKDNGTGKVWEVKVDRRGVPIGPVVTPSWDDRTLGYFQSELKYEVWQYSLIVWCLQKILFEQWATRECYEVIKHFWRHLPGQPPLMPRTIGMWLSYHKSFAKKELLWP